MLSSTELGHLRSLTRHQLDLAQRMDALLQAEHCALKAGNTELITGIANEKIALLNTLEDQERQRSAWLLAKFPELKVYDRRALLRLAAPEHRREFATELAKLFNVLQSCRRQNQINGAIAHASRQFAERSLNVLRGQAQHDAAPSLYGRRGETVNQETSFSVTSA